MAFYSRHVKAHLTSAQNVTLRKLTYPFHKCNVAVHVLITIPVLLKIPLNVEKNSSSLYFLPFLIILLKYDCTQMYACAPAWWPDVFWSTSLVQPSPLATLHHSECCSLFLTRMLEIHSAIPSSDSYWVSKTPGHWKPVSPSTVTTAWDIPSTSAVWAAL